MKTIIHLPLICPEDYDAFRAILKGNLPDTYEEWEQVHFQQITDCYRQGLAHSQVLITPAEFSTYCRMNGYAPKALHLRRLAREKAA
jgi:hypothetical protein